MKNFFSLLLVYAAAPASCRTTTNNKIGRERGEWEEVFFGLPTFCITNWDWAPGQHKRVKFYKPCTALYGDYGCKFTSWNTINDMLWNKRCLTFGENKRWIKGATLKMKFFWSTKSISFHASYCNSRMHSLRTLLL